jgi:C4-dicarboxylate-specific signal transduction histidine kinase
MSAIADRPRELAITTQRVEMDKLRVSVRDSGIGVAAQDIEWIFDPFCTTKREGMGMGLSISRSIIEAHGGRLWAARNHGAGTTLQFTLPVVPA